VEELLGLPPAGPMMGPPPVSSVLVDLIGQVMGAISSAAVAVEGGGMPPVDPMMGDPMADPGMGDPMLEEELPGEELPLLPEELGALPPAPTGTDEIDLDAMGAAFGEGGSLPPVPGGGVF